MRILKFEGATMRDAIAKVKAELGDQAVIIATRQIKRGLLGGTAVEISAAIDDTESRTPAFTAAPKREIAPPPKPDVSELISPLRSEMRSLRAMVRASDSNRGTADLRSEVAELRKLVERLGNAPAAPVTITTAPSPPVARRAPSAVSTETPPRRPTMRQMLTKPSTGRVLVLVGPTGAGKTTTIAKLAARAALIEEKRVRLITLDNYRVGGVDQIRTFADLIGVPLAVAESPADLATLLSDGDADSYDLTLVDTAGKSPRDTSSIVDLAGELPNLPQLEIHVVLPASTSHAAAEALINRYRPLSPSRLLVTKVDEVDVPADLATLPTRTGLPITWITTGQAVPEDIEEPSPARLIDLATNGLSPNPTSRAA